MKYTLYLCIFMSGMLPYIYGDEYAHCVHETTWASYLSFDKKQNANQWYQEVIDTTTLPYPLRSYSLYLSSTEQHAALLRYKKQLQIHFKDDLEVQKAIAIALVHEKQDGEAEELFVSLAAQFPTSYEVVLPAVQVALRRGEHAHAKEMLEKVVNTRTQRQLMPVALSLLAQLYIKENNIDAAYDIITQCTTAYAAYSPAWLILGTLEELKHNSEKALQAYRTFCSLSPLPIPDVEKRIAALQLQSKAPHVNTVNYTGIQRSLMLIMQKKYDEALTFTRALLKVQPADAAIRALYIHLLVSTGSYKSALALLTQYIAEQPTDYRWWGALHIVALNHDAAVVAQMTLRQMRLQYPHLVWGYLYEADFNLRTGSYTDAYRLYTHAHHLTTDEVMKAELYFMQALCGYELHDYTIVAQAIHDGLALSVIHAPLCNVAAYYYAHSGQYARAQKLIVQCCALEPHNYHYQDTAAFIAYKKHDFQSAEKIFTLLHRNYADDAMISVHAAQVVRKQNKYADVRILLAQAENHAYSEYVKRRLQSYQEVGTV